MKRLGLCVMLAACSYGGDDVIGPFSGTVHRFVVADDLDGDDAPENKFGYATAVLAATGDLSPHAPEMIASGALASVVEIQTADLDSSARAGVRYLGRSDDGADQIGATITDGVLVTNRSRSTRHPGTAVVRLPVFVNADPVTLRLERVELELVPDGAGGYDGIVRGGIRERNAREAAHAGLVEMFETEPERHLVFARGVDTDRDDVLSYDEIEASVIGLLVARDMEPDLVSIAFAIHLRPCAEGTCTQAAPQELCRDRVRDGDETDVDCGGSCQPCAAAKQCIVAADCQSHACDAGRCRAASCSNGVRDGYESDVDCGGRCPACASGLVCAADRDCTSGACSSGIASLGTCS
jgi:hypothetical protein